MSRFDFTLKHVLGTRMGKADGLSRKSDWKVSVDRDNENQIFIKDNWVRSLQEVVVVATTRHSRSNDLTNE